MVRVMSWDITASATLAGPIIVGYDGSSSADYALRWGWQESRLRHTPIQVVHVIEWPVTVSPGESQFLSQGQRLAVAAELTASAQAASGFTGEVSIFEGSVVGTMCMLSKQAGLMVNGSRGIGGFAGLLIGSTSSSVAVHASCPVVVVRGEEHPDSSQQPVIVGVDDSAQSRPAIYFAFAEAAARGCDVVAIHGWNPQADPLGEMSTAERHTLYQALEPAQAHYPEVKFSVRLVAGRPGKALIDASAEAQSVIVGARGKNGFKGLLLGSVGLHLLHHALCPVAIVR